MLTFNAIPNIDQGNNKFYVGKEIITIPTGSYEIEDITNYLQDVLNDKEITLSLKPNNNTLCSEIESNHEIDFTSGDSIGNLLGFTQRRLNANVVHTSDLPVAILSINSIRVECNITKGAYINGNQVHTIHEFFSSVPPGYKIIEKPSTIIYLPIAVEAIDHLQLRLVDQDGELINFRGEIITISLHVKS